MSENLSTQQQLKLQTAFETWASKRLGVDLFAGLTMPEIRRDRMRRWLIGERLEQVIAGRSASTRKPQTWAEAFEQVYGEQLTPKGGLRQTPPEPIQPASPEDSDL